MEKIKISILPNYFLNNDGTFNKNAAMKMGGHIAGVCYDKEGYKHIINEPEEKTMKRVNRTLNLGHHSVYDHINITIDIQNIPKILAMVLNNEKDYTTSEKSARYTAIERRKGSIITDKEEELYEKWLRIFTMHIKEKYSYIYDDNKTRKLAQENARYFVTSFMPTQMVYTTSLRQFNYIASFMEKYIEQAHTPFERKLASYMNEFINSLSDLNILEEDLMKNEKHRELSLFGKKITDKEEYFGDVYQTLYMGSIAQFAQAQRHRTLLYELEFLDYDDYFIPPIIMNNQEIVDEYLSDMQFVKNLNPQGQLVLISEQGTYENFILKCKERLCSNAQLEIMDQTKKTLLRYKAELERKEHYLATDIEKYSHGARCTFPDYECLADCKFKEGKTLIRKI